ncbi:sulfur carrier protein ThiS [Rhodococcus sp. D2-41]|uniref:Sulfur carrier protein ThiS n=1 Tax=Speluncibacter jeojiensis TaxID=2710754 RepID=A0A9X4M2Z2_9ACTN|nr:sulfur carrier protein ThiS [Rhodococcus sp. D2-41]MDG3010055.1 sulfur carrier protein ThiS [Rhodococcus sp. D2-41]MDG3016241.1 sulfur carrier protein ThiS [Corynebacteriales bacterium D3-21]
MEVTVNGDRHELDSGSTLDELMAALGMPARGVAVAVDGRMVPRSQWSQAVADGSAIEVLTAVQGG